MSPGPRTPDRFPLKIQSTPLVAKTTVRVCRAWVRVAAVCAPERAPLTPVHLLCLGVSADSTRGFAAARVQEGECTRRAPGKREEVAPGVRAGPVVSRPGRWELSCGINCLFVSGWEVAPTSCSGDQLLPLRLGPRGRRSPRRRAARRPGSGSARSPGSGSAGAAARLLVTRAPPAGCCAPAAARLRGDRAPRVPSGEARPGKPWSGWRHQPLRAPRHAGRPSHRFHPLPASPEPLKATPPLCFAPTLPVA